MIIRKATKKELSTDFGFSKISDRFADNHIFMKNSLQTIVIQRVNIGRRLCFITFGGMIFYSEEKQILQSDKRINNYASYRQKHNHDWHCNACFV